MAIQIIWAHERVFIQIKGGDIQKSWNPIVEVDWSEDVAVLLHTSAVYRLIGEVVQSRRRPLLGPSPHWKHLLALSNLRHYANPSAHYTTSPINRFATLVWVPASHRHRSALCRLVPAAVTGARSPGFLGFILAHCPQSQTFNFAHAAILQVTTMRNHVITSYNGRHKLS